MQAYAGLSCMVFLLLAPSSRAAKVKGIQQHVVLEEHLQQDRTMGSKSIIIQRDSIQEPFNTLIKELGKIMNQGLVEDSGGGCLGALRSELYNRLGKKWRPFTVCEFGSIAGNSTSTLLAHANMSVYEFDSGANGYAKKAESAPVFKQDSPDVCDVMIMNDIDSDNVVTAEIQYMSTMALNHHVLIFEKTACSGPTHAWNALLTKGCLAELAVSKSESHCGYRVGVLSTCKEVHSVAGNFWSWWHRLGYTNAKGSRTSHLLSIAGAVVGGLVALGWTFLLTSRLRTHLANKNNLLEKQRKLRRNDKLVFQ